MAKPHFSLVLKEYDEDIILDVVSCLRTYLAKSSSWRLIDQQKTHLFLSYIDKHKPVITCTLAGWLKSVMCEADIDISTYKAHSTRSANTSQAHFAGLSVEQIAKQGNWTNAKTFNKFYFKHTQEKCFQNIVLK